MNFSTKFQILNKNISLLSYHALIISLKKRTGLNFSPFFKIALFHLPLKLMDLIVPKSFMALLSNSYLYYKIYDKSIYFSLKAIKNKITSRYAISLLLDAYRDQNLDTEIREFMNKSLNVKQFDSSEIDAILAWAFFNLPYHEFNQLLEKVKEVYFETSKPQDVFSENRFLPDYSRNLGHLTSMYLYAQYYQSVGSNRRINIIKNRADNKFYLGLLKRSLSLEINEIPEESFPIKTDSNFRSFDHLLYSFENYQNIRIESGADHSHIQKTPEWDLAYKNPIKLTASEIDLGDDLLKNVLKGRWFIALHIRGPKENLFNAQARDSLIDNYKLMSEYVSANGGVVVRMGDRRFAKLDSNFPAFDYANSELRSEFLDCWLWANCKFWVGNMNGTALTALVFGKKRLITNQWYWNIRGVNDDMIIPKLLCYKNSILNVEETVNSKMGRQMNRNYLKMHGYELLENSSKDILNGYLDFEASKSNEISQIDESLRKHMNLEWFQGGLMRVAPSFATNWANRVHNN
jgi:putative glycosyltransferase (TIGR04372 family)